MRDKVPAVKCNRIVAWLGSLLASVSLLFAQQNAAPKGIFGIYGQSSPGHDSIRVTRRPGGKIGLAVKLYYANGHTCQLEAEGEWRAAHLVVMAEGADPNQPCSLNAYFSRGRISLKDEGWRCAPVYCGTRGKLDKVSLSKSSVDRK
jgi:hypothetical protein